MAEVATMLAFKHSNVMSLFGVCFDEDIPLIIMPYMLNGSVLLYVKQKRKELHFEKQAQEEVCNTLLYYHMIFSFLLIHR